jgi:hypothetical protein
MLQMKPQLTLMQASARPGKPGWPTVVQNYPKPGGSASQDYAFAFLQ